MFSVQRAEHCPFSTIERLESNGKSPDAQMFLRAVSTNEEFVSAFLERYPAWERGFKQRVIEITRAAEKAENNIRKKEIEKQWPKALQKAVQKEVKILVR